MRLRSNTPEHLYWNTWTICLGFNTKDHPSSQLCAWIFLYFASTGQVLPGIIEVTSLSIFYHMLREKKAKWPQVRACLQDVPSRGLFPWKLLPSLQKRWLAYRLYGTEEWWERGWAIAMSESHAHQNSYSNGAFEYPLGLPWNNNAMSILSLALYSPLQN